MTLEPIVKALALVDKAERIARRQAIKAEDSGRLSGFPLNMETLSLANDLQALLETYSHQYERGSK